MKSQNYEEKAKISGCKLRLMRKKSKYRGCQTQTYEEKVTNYRDCNSGLMRKKSKYRILMQTQTYEKNSLQYRRLQLRIMRKKSNISGFANSGIMSERKSQNIGILATLRNYEKKVNIIRIFPTQNYEEKVKISDENFRIYEEKVTNIED